ncbi:hypothetical protein [Phaeobacter sp. JH20_32]|uniref:hypothetical protein n=1 Tax=Phaeobacter sp. JH20_32 TaxID=3112489 RepID=UPI003A874AD1
MIQIEVLFADIEMPGDAPKVVRRGHSNAIEVSIELLTVQADIAADLRNAAVVSAEGSQVPRKVFRHATSPSHIDALMLTKA